MHIRHVVGALLAGALTVVPATVGAQGTMMASNPRGFFAGVDLSINSLKSGNDGVDDVFEAQDGGGGLGLHLGYGFTPAFSIFARFGGAGMRNEGQMPGEPDVDYALGQFDLGARFNFTNPSRKLVPYVDLALTGLGLVYEANDVGEPDDLELGGAGVSAGGGVHYFFTPKFSVNAALSFTSGELTERTIGEQKVEISEKVTASRLSLGVSWFPMAGR